MICKEEFDTYCENRVINALCGRNTEGLNGTAYGISSYHWALNG